MENKIYNPEYQNDYNMLSSGALGHNVIGPSDVSDDTAIYSAILCLADTNLTYDIVDMGNEHADVGSQTIPMKAGMLIQGRFKNVSVPAVGQVYCYLMNYKKDNQGVQI